VDKNTSIGIFDSGVGGLSVLDACRVVLPSENFLYYADFEFAPYGDKSDEYIKNRVFAICEMLINRGVKAIVIACNTATNVGIKMLREKYSLPIVGLEPAIKPAIEKYKDKKIVLLCTEATARQQKLKDLIEKYDGKSVVVCPQKELASLIENNFCSLEKVSDYIENSLSHHLDASAIVLGCTHYVFVKDIIEKFFESQNLQVLPEIFDGNLGATNRLHSLLKTYNLLSSKSIIGNVVFLR